MSRVYRIVHIAAWRRRRYAPAVGLAEDLERYVALHRTCGRLTGDATTPTPDGYLIWIACACGARFERWVTPEAAAEDLVRSPLTALPN